MRLSSLSKSVKVVSILCLSMLCSAFENKALAHADPLAILGGQGDAPYAAFIQADGSIVKLKGLPPTGLTYRVAMNASKHSIIGGTSGLDAYAAQVSRKGKVKPLLPLISPGEIYTVGINPSGRGIIGGGHLDSNVPYAARISKKGIVTPISLPENGLIYSVAIDKHGQGIIGGISSINTPFVAIVSSKGVITGIEKLPAIGAIYWVASNNAKTKFIGGQENGSVYAAFVNYENTLQPINGLPLGLLYSVDINASGNAIMGGTSLALPYAALVDPQGNVKNLTNLPMTAGKIYNVAINDAGTGLIAGFSTTGPYGSFVASNGKLTPLIGLPTGDGFLDGAALHSSGIGIVGGTISNVPFAALVAPNGTLTYLNGLPLQGEINSISIGSISGLVPKRIGPFDSLANMQFALGNALTQHLIIQKDGGPEECLCSQSLQTICDNGTNSLWLSGFGNYVRERANNSLPGFSNKIGGIILGAEHKGIYEIIVGGALAYTNNCVDYFKNQGNAHIHQESAVLYASWNNAYYCLNAALWGGLYQSTHKRHNILSFTSSAKPSGWNLSPQLELDIPIQLTLSRNLVADPFVTLQWANNWHNRFREKGDSGFNIKLKDHCTSIFRSEIGLRLFETLQLGWGQIVLEEKVSYVNRALVGKYKTEATFLGAASSFGVRTLNTVSKNLGNVQLHIECLPYRLNNFTFALDYQGEFGSFFQSHLLTLLLEKNF